MSMFQPMQTTNRSLEGRIVDRIRDLVERGELSAGERLPPERELATQLGVSRSVLREAIATLAALGLVESRHGRGVFIVGGSVQASAQRLSLALVTNDNQTQTESVARIRELFEIRRVLEGTAAEWAALRATEEQIAELLAVLTKDKAVRSAEPVDTILIGELDGRLHALIVACTANRMLLLLMGALLDELSLARSKSLTIPGRIVRSSHQHEALVHAISAHDAPGAHERMLEHINDVEQTILKHMKEEEERKR